MPIAVRTPLVFPCYVPKMIIFPEPCSLRKRKAANFLTGASDICRNPHIVHHQKRKNIVEHVILSTVNSKICHKANSRNEERNDILCSNSTWIGVGEIWIPIDCLTAVESQYFFLVHIHKDIRVDKMCVKLVD